MKKTLYIAFAFLLINVSAAQVVGTPYVTSQVEVQRPVLDQLGVTPSFAFSTRKLRSAYSGFAARVRRSTDNAEANIAFDTNDVVSDNSTVTVAVAGGSLSVGNTLTLADFRSGSTLTVTIWYDQGTNGYNGIQNTTSRQPVFSLGVAGLTNQYASLVFTGASKHNVTVNQTIPVLLGSGLRGSVMMIGRTLTTGLPCNAWGYSELSATNTTNIRWMAHQNWSDNNMYTDLGSGDDASRSFLNSSGIGVYKQYTIIRTNTNKTVKTSGITRFNPANLNLTSQTWAAGSTFGVGMTTGGLDTFYNQNGYTGNIPEFILFQEPLTVWQYRLLENNQILFWGAF